jgi:proline racemase
MDAGGYPSMSGHAVIAITTIAFERRLALAHPPGSGEERLVFDTPAGPCTPARGSSCTATRDRSTR